MMRTKMLAPLAVAATALAAAGPAAAKSPHPTRYDKKQNAAINKQNVAIKKVATSTSKAGKSAKAANLAAAKVAKDLGAAAGTLKSTSDGLGAIQAAVPAVLDGLTKLKDGLTQAADGLKQLQAGVTSLADAYQAVEYGVVKVSTDNGQFATSTSTTSPDIPDDGNVAQANGTAVFIATGASNSITMRADIRSNEADGAAGAGPVGQVGGTLYVKDLMTGVLVGCGVPYAASGGIAGTPPGASIVTANGTLTNLNLVNISEGQPRTDQTHPDASSTNVIPAPCTITTVATHPYEITYSANFVDVPTSTSPGPKD